MAFSYTVERRTVIGNLRLVAGTYTNASGDTGGDINTGLVRVEHFQLQPKGTAILASAPVVNETLPMSGGTVTIVTNDDEDGTWCAIGY